MDHEESAITPLAVTVTPRLQWLTRVLSVLKRTPEALRSRVIKASALLIRKGTEVVHRLQRRRIAHFLHIGKTGGTAVVSVLSRYLNVSDYEIILHEHHVKLNNVPRGEKVFFFVRDPISRFVSGFYSRKRQGRPRHDVPWTPAENAAFARFTTPNELALALSSDDKLLQSAAVDAIQSIGHLNMPHWTWFKNERYFLSRGSDILFIGFQESLNEDFVMLTKLLNLPEEVRLPEDEFTSHKNPSDVDKQLDEAAIRNLKAWYHRDYQFLELCREVAARIRDDFQRTLSQSAWREPATSASASGESPSRTPAP